MKKYIIQIGFLVGLLAFQACENQLEEIPVSDLSNEGVLKDSIGFDAYITGLHQAARDEFTNTDGINHNFNMHYGTDIATTGSETIAPFRNHQTYLTPNQVVVNFYWTWAYQKMILRANTIIEYLARPEAAGYYKKEASRNAVLAEARFFRAYAYNVLANLYGGVPIVDQVYAVPKTDFVRSSRKEVYEFAKNDLEFAAQWLPATVDKSKEGHIVRAAADHLLSEVYMSLGDYNKSIEAASRVINSGLYNLMTTRFGSEKDKAGDVFSDLFRNGNQNRSSGNRESIYVLQIEDQTPGGQGGTGGNNNLRAWGPFISTLKDPAGKNGFVVSDSLGRGVGWVRPNNYFNYTIWQNNFTNDIRNSRFNIRRAYKYNNKASAYFNTTVEKRTSKIDTLYMIYPTIRKIEGNVPKSGDNSTGRIFTDLYVYRLAETYLLRAEAYFRSGNAQKAAEDINVVRSRANAKPASPADMSLDYILDERARELTVEEPRRRTLVRMGNLVERVRKYNIREDSRTSIQDKHLFFPIPQSAIDANFSVQLEQNPGY
ncbi:membrane protein [Adhaeribacter aerolatus]|uniref:Membrane protein n=1 Tax=Adhaeribacter aerolatus TaxID=670289 RepID=A0A512B2D1_9BACT|nr:RagB/SusD family nutrient uptake outer membrane protein [Adhaeribacter aerolatus]GEO06123.1 membrane protein [Adhaeribacter aerolatus]